jgi:hypothetical protein
MIAHDEDQRRIGGMARGIVEHDAERVVDGLPVLIAHPVPVAPDHVRRIARSAISLKMRPSPIAVPGTRSGTGTHGAWEEPSASCAKSGRSS